MHIIAIIIHLALEIAILITVIKTVRRLEDMFEFGRKEADFQIALERSREASVSLQLQLKDVSHQLLSSTQQHEDLSNHHRRCAAFALEAHNKLLSITESVSSREKKNELIQVLLLIEKIHTPVTNHNE